MVVQTRLSPFYFAKSTNQMDSDLYSEFERDNHKMTFKGRDEDTDRLYRPRSGGLLADDYVGASCFRRYGDAFLPDLIVRIINL